MVQLVKGLTSQANDLDFVLQAGGSHLGVILSPTDGSSLAMSGDTELLQQRRHYWHLVGKARDAAKPPSMHCTLPTTKNDLDHNVSGDIAEKSCCRERAGVLNQETDINIFIFLNMHPWALIGRDL